MTPSKLRQLGRLAEARKLRDLADLEAAVAEDRMLRQRILDLASTPIRDMAEGLIAMPVAQQEVRQVWAQRQIALCRARRAELAGRIEALRRNAARSLGKHEAIGKLVGSAEAEASEAQRARSEREAPPHKLDGSFGD